MCRAFFFLSNYWGVAFAGLRLFVVWWFLGASFSAVCGLGLFFCCGIFFCVFLVVGFGCCCVLFLSYVFFVVESFGALRIPLWV